MTVDQTAALGCVHVDVATVEQTEFVLVPISLTE